MRWTFEAAGSILLFFIFLNKFICLFLAALGPRCCARASHCCGLSCCGARAPGARASAAVAHRLQSTGSAAVVHGPSCSAACGNPPRQGIEPASPVLAGRFLTTVLPGKPRSFYFIGGETEAHKANVICILAIGRVRFPTQAGLVLKPRLFRTIACQL